MSIKLPLVVLGYGDYSKTKKLFAVVNVDGIAILPVFTDFELAESYRNYHNDMLKENTLQISVTDRDDNNPPEATIPPYGDENQINGLIISELQHARDAFVVINITNRVTYIAVDPPIPGSENNLCCMEIDEFLEALQPAV